MIFSKKTIDHDRLFFNDLFMILDLIYRKKYAKRSHFIFVTFEWYTYQPDSESSEPDIENMQVIWFSQWFSREEAYSSLLQSNSHLLDTSFDEVWCMKIDGEKYNCMFSLSEKRELAQVKGE